YTSLPTKLSLYTDNPVVLSTLRTWYQFRQHFKFVGASSLCPLVNNHLFPPSCMDSSFSVWYDKGIKQVRNLYSDGVFDSFANLASTYDLPLTHFFRYFQIRNFVSRFFPDFPSAPPEQAWEDLFSNNPHQKGMISKIYDFILTQGSGSSNKIRNALETELGVQISEECWEHAIGRVQTTTSCARLSRHTFMGSWHFYTGKPDYEMLECHPDWIPSLHLG
ncbi:hypothetical protein AMELA_G00070460, partial [Ameiurus melas]